MCGGAAPGARAGAAHPPADPNSAPPDDAGGRPPPPVSAPDVKSTDEAGPSESGEAEGSWVARNADDLITYGAALLISLGIRA